MGMSAQDELRQEVIQTLVKAGWTEQAAIAAIKEIAGPIHGDAALWLDVIDDVKDSIRYLKELKLWEASIVKP